MKTWPLLAIVGLSCAGTDEPQSTRVAQTVEVREVKLIAQANGRVARAVLVNPTSEPVTVLCRFRYLNAEGHILSMGPTEYQAVRIEAQKEATAEEPCIFKEAVRAEIVLGGR